MVGPALQREHLHINSMEGGAESQRGAGSPATFWKMKREGKVLEMSSLMRSRLDSLSARDAPSARETQQRDKMTLHFHVGHQRRTSTPSVVPLSLSLTELVSL